MRTFVQELRTPRQRPSVVIACGLLGLSIALSGCGVPAVLREAGEVANPAVLGELTFRDPDGGTLVVWTPDSCISGEVEQFHGFDISSSREPAGSGIRLRAVLDPLDGPGLRITGLEGSPREGIVLRKADCRTLDLRLSHTGWRVNDVYDLSGSLDVSCAASGLELEGSVEVHHCH